MSEETEKIEIEITSEADGERLDKYIGNDESVNLSRSKLTNLIDDGHVTINGVPAKAKMKLLGGDKIVIEIPPVEEPDILAENIPIDIVFEDEHLIVVNKPAGMVTHPAIGNYSGTLVNALMYYTKNLSSVGGMERLGVVHRLDKNTSGLLMVAKTDEAHAGLQDLLRDQQVEKKYHALVCGHMKEEEGVIDLPIGRSISDRKKMVVTDLRSRDAVTEYKVLDTFKLYDLLEINLKTGRTQQIRVHFSHKGHPVLGDPEYGGRDKWHKGVVSYEKLLGVKSLKLIDHQALHAKSLRFIHPLTDAVMFCDYDLPEDFAKLKEFLENEGR